MSISKKKKDNSFLFLHFASLEHSLF